MLRKAKKDSSSGKQMLNTSREASRPTRQSFPGIGLSSRPLRKSLPSPSTSPTTGRKSSMEKRKISRVHLGRLHFMPDNCIDDEPDPSETISQYDFFMAASSGRIKTVKKFLDDGGDINTVDSCKRTALHRASLYEQSAVVNLLIDRGANVNKADKLRNTPLHWACRGTNIEVVQILLANKAKINAKDELLNAPLHVATRVGFIECVNYLLECGAKINEKDCEGDTPIHDAIRLGRPKVVRTLILHGANMEIKNKLGQSAANLVQTWYNNVKEAVANAEAERKRKCLNTEKLALELEDIQDTWSEHCGISIELSLANANDTNGDEEDDHLNFKKPKKVLFAQDSEDICCDISPNRKPDSESFYKETNTDDKFDELNTTSTACEKKLENMDASNLRDKDANLETRQHLTNKQHHAVSLEETLSQEEQQGLSKMEKAIPIIKEQEGIIRATVQCRSRVEKDLSEPPA